MKKYYYYFFFMFVFVILSCKTEEDIIPSEESGNYFEVNPLSTNKYDLLKKNFYTRNGVYLLLNDTLRKEQAGFDYFGNVYYKIELLDLSYGINSSSKNKYNYIYLNDENKIKHAISFLEMSILPLLSTNLLPYSILIVDKIEESFFMKEEGDYEGYYYSYLIDFKRATRATVFALGNIDSDNFDAKSLRNNYIKEYIKSCLLINKASISEFYLIGKDFYNYYNTFYGNDDILDADWFYAKGVLSFYSYYDDWEGTTIVSSGGEDSELEAFIERICWESESDFNGEFRDFPLIIKKYELLKKSINNLGFNIDKLFN